MLKEPRLQIDNIFRFFNTKEIPNNSNKIILFKKRVQKIEIRDK